METRKITVVQTKNQRKVVIMSAATTLSELKADLKSNGIDYDGMTFFEGTSKTELKTDASVLPHDVPYKGQITNELVFLLTNTNKKIKSGSMSRAEAYNAIKSMGLQDECVKKFGKNFTMCKTADLVTLIESYNDECSSECSSECVDIVARAAIDKLVHILEDNETIDCCDREKVLDILESAVAVTPPDKHKSELTSSYSNDEINSMFDFEGYL